MEHCSSNSSIDFGFADLKKETTSQPIISSDLQEETFEFFGRQVT